eukprot:TRINITY_DN1068_c5_g1_i1.p1 TRINITY_DN1068_c5_g1~~TRINITY_DN1068_c5_g1_i1.p1  ORF type:complete len:304 (+),score=51.76 TRINITY_DN1068_c5_g1_i1:85-996(+)
MAEIHGRSSRGSRCGWQRCRVRFGCQALLAMSVAASSAAAARPEVVPRTELSHPCSRVVSRNVRKQLEKEILRPAQQAGLTSWPSTCPLDPAKDLYAFQERQKGRKRGSTTQWTCGICQKVFKNEHYLDLHMERKHMDQAPRNGICLADYCEMFEICHGNEARYRRPSKKEEEPPACNNQSMAIARQRCETSLSKCLPLQKEESRKLHAKLSRHYCQTLDCRIRAEQQKEQNSELMPVIVLLILVMLLCFVVFSMVVCCVDYSDDVFAFLVDSKIASQETVRSAVKARDQTRQTLGLDRTKCI